jgi:hypothetical protein
MPAVGCKLMDNFFFDTRPTNLTAQEFELLVKNYLENIGHKLEQLEIVHNDKIVAYDGKYQIDVRANFIAFGTRIIVLVECKHQKAKIKRKEIEVLLNRLHATGSHKGIFFTTSGYQEGAIDFAIKHGIALVKICESEGHALHFTAGPVTEKPVRLLPKFIAEIFYVLNDDLPEIDLLVDDLSVLNKFIASE